MLMLWLAQVQMPDDGQNPWVWVAGTATFLLVALGGTLGAVFWHVVADKDRQIAQLREDGKTCASEMGKTGETLRTMTDVSDRQRQTIVEGLAANRQAIAEGFAVLGRQMSEILDIMAPRRRAE